MANWDHGYVTDVAYTTNAYIETTPSWLAASAIILQHRPVDLTASFRYADLGCGNGLNAMVVAAANPKAQVWGFDFNPTHIENARELAARAGLTNIVFEEMSFEALAKGEADLPGRLDVMVSHGVLSWISLENQRHLAAAFDRWLRPGGLAYLSYNVATGWAAMEPLRLLMRQLADQGQRRSDQEVPDIVAALEQLKTGGALFFQAHPGLEARFEQLKRMDPRYIAHEFLNRDWHPVMFAEVAEMMSEARGQYIGSATLLENIDALSVPPNVVPAIAAVRDPVIRETMRDIGAAKAFRRDLWRRGGEPIPPLEQAARLDALGLVWTGKAMDGSIQFATPFGSLTGQPEFYTPMIELLRKGSVTLAQLRAIPALRDRPLGDFTQAATLLIGAGYAFPVSAIATQAETIASTARLNAALVQRTRLGVDMPCLASPVSGCSVGVTVMEVLAIGRMMEGTPADPERLTDHVLGDLGRSGRSLMNEGEVVRDPVQARAMVANAMREFVAGRLSVLKGLGIVPA